MKKLFLPLACIACAGVLHAQDVSTARWMTQPVTVDGVANEWHQPLNFYDSETKLLFAISNDSTNIYLCFEAKDNATEMKIMRAGMRVELDTKGRSGRSASIDFPLPPKERNGQEEDENSQRKTGGDSSMQGGGFGAHRGDPSMFRQRFLTNNITMEIKGFADGNGMVPIRGRAINVAMNWDDADNLFYEISIPIKELLEDGYTADDILKEITLHAEVNGIRSSGGGGGNNTETNAGAGGGGFGGGGRGGGGGFGGRGGGRGGGGMRGGGMRGGQGGGGDAMSQKTSFKQKFVLGTNAPQ